MAFAVVETTNISNDSGTSHIVNLPSGIVAGNLLIVFFDHKETASAVVFPAGWVQLYDVNIPALNKMVGYYRDADGTEGATITVTTTFGADTNHNAYRISGAEPPSIQPPEVATSLTANPPNLTPTGGAKDYLWFTALGKSNTANGSPPTNYGNELSSRVGGSGCESARRNLNAASENPGAWGTPGSDPITATLAVHPANPTVTLSGTITNDNESDIRAGSSTIILDLVADTWVAAGGTFDAQRQNIIDGIDSAQSEATGWDAVARPAIPVGNVVRSTDTRVTITMPVVPTYSISANETVEATVPASALVTSTDPLIATPIFVILFLVESVALSGTIVGDTELDVRNGGSTIILDLTNDTWVTAGATFNAERQGIIDGLVSGGAETNGWNAVVVTAFAVTDVVRTSNTRVTITVPTAGIPGYNITGNETITATIPASALVVSFVAVIASPTFVITFLTETTALSGTIIGDDDAAIRAGGSTLILTLSNAEWEANVGANNAQTQALIDGLDSNQAEANGWDAVVRAGLSFADVTRNSDTVVTILMPAFPTYNISVNETITPTMPASALEFPIAIVASPTLLITDLAVNAPVIAASQTSVDTNSPHTVTLPSGIVAGNMLIIIFGDDSGFTGATLPNWTKLAEVASVADPNGRIDFAVFFRRADGTEGGSVDITTTFGADSAHIALRITGDDGNESPEISSIPLVVTNTPNPASLTPTGGVKNYLWIAMVGHQKTISSSPSNYSNLISINGVGIDLGAISRRRNIGTEDPGTPTPPDDDLFTLSDPGDPDITAAATLAVHGAPVGIPGGSVGTIQREIFLL